MADATYDLIIIGGGAIGLSTAYHAGKRGMRTLVLEKFGVLNDQGSSAGASRQFRLQYAQAYMSELSLVSQEFWAEFQGFSQSPLIQLNGSLWFGDPTLDKSQIETRFPFQNLPADYSGFFQANGGIINLKQTEAAAFNAALSTGCVDIHEFEPSSHIGQSGRGVKVTTALGAYKGAKLAICAGAYVNDTLRQLDLSLGIDIWQMSSAYFAKTAPQVKLPIWFVFQAPSDTSLFYGFPEVDWAHPGYLRVATDFPDRVLSDPSQRSFIPSAKSLALDEAWVSDHMTGLDPTPRLTATCLIALAQQKDRELLLDYTPAWGAEHANIVTYSAGWAAKYIPILGDMIVRMLEEPTKCLRYGDFEIPLGNFAIDWKGPVPDHT